VDTTAFGTGAYALTMSFAGAPLPAVPLPNTQTANANPLSGGGGLADSTNTLGNVDSSLSDLTVVAGKVVGSVLGVLNFLSAGDEGGVDTYAAAEPPSVLPASPPLVSLPLPALPGAAAPMNAGPGPTSGALAGQFLSLIVNAAGSSSAPAAVPAPAGVRLAWAGTPVPGTGTDGPVAERSLDHLQEPGAGDGKLVPPMEASPGAAEAETSEPTGAPLRPAAPDLFPTRNAWDSHARNESGTTPSVAGESGDPLMTPLTPLVQSAEAVDT
jgi:hypothetical protein